MFFYWLKGPELSCCLQIQFLFFCSCFTLDTRVRRAHGHPFFKISNLFRGQFLFGRHFYIRIGMTDCLNEEAFANTPRNDGCPRFTPFLPSAFPV